MWLRPTEHESPAGSLLLIAVLSVVRLSAALNAAVAHLVMARGTGPDNRTTQWSVH